MPIVRIKIPDVVLDEREETDEELNKQKSEAKKKAKKEIAWKILKNVCALHNSNGGTLELFSTHDYPLNPDSVVRAVEELSQIVFNISEILENFKICDQTTNSLTFHIQGSPSLTTMRYNIFLPTETQVLEVRQVHSKREVRQRMDRKICEPNQDEVPADFIFGNSSGLQESQTVQFKNLKTEATSKITFSRRVIHNKFTRHVSAFANHRGGRIYYGIKDDGVVAGEALSAEEKDRVTDRIKNEIDKMPCHGASGSSGVEWEITFEPVKDGANQSIESTFVMIVLIKPFLGVVFTEEPESYRIEKKEVVKINFDDWLMHFKMGEQPWAISVIPPDVSDRVQWTSKRNRDIYLHFTIALVQCRNDNDMEKFNLWRELAKEENYKRTDASLIVRLENVAVHYKKHEFSAASKLLERLKLAIRGSRDPKFHLAKVLYLESRIKRAQGKYEQCYKLAKRCYQVVAALPAEFITVWCYMQLAMLANIFGVRENIPTKYSKAQEYLQLALRVTCTLNQYPTGLPDLQQKLFIYRAMTLLKCSLIGEVSSLDVSSEHINAAVQELTKVYKSFMNGDVMSQYREIQYLFAQCSLFLRYSEDTAKNPLKRHEFLKRAQRWVDEAKDLATKCGFNDMEGYATSFQNIVKTRAELVIEEINKYPQLLTLLKLK